MWPSVKVWMLAWQPQPRKDQPRAAEPLTRGLLEDTSSHTRSFGEKKKTSKKESKQENHVAALFLCSLFPPREAGSS